MTPDHVSLLQGTKTRHAERRSTKHGRHGRYFQRWIVVKRRHENVLFDRSEGGERRGICVLEGADAGGFAAGGAGWEELEGADAVGLVEVVYQGSGDSCKLILETIVVS